MRNRNRKKRHEDHVRRTRSRWKVVFNILTILMLAAEVIMIYPGLLTARASPMTSTLHRYNRRSTSSFAPASRSSCTIGRAWACASDVHATTPTPTPTPTRVSRTLSGVIYNPTVNGGSPVVGIKDRNQTVSFNFETDVIDNRGSGAGWKVSETTTALKFGSDSSTSDLFLDAIKPIVVTCATNSTCTSTSAIGLAPLGQDMVPGPVTLADAPFATGIGAFSLTILGYFVVPTNAVLGQTTGGVITVTISGAP